MKIRIGNDIKMLVQLSNNSNDLVNIISANAYIINRTAHKAALDRIKKKTAFLNRFPVHEYFLEPSQHNINIVGNVGYNCYPHHHAYRGYEGFGYYPKWDSVYTPIVDNCNIESYKPEIKFTETRGTIEIIFPAEAQLYTGEYDIVVVANIYQEGFSKNNLRTVTVDYKNAFELVQFTEEADEDANGTVNLTFTLDDVPSLSDDIYVNGAAYENNILSLQRNGASEPVSVKIGNVWKSY